MKNLIFRNQALFEEVAHNGFAVIDFSEEKSLKEARIVESFFLDRNTNTNSHFDSLTVDDILLTQRVHYLLKKSFSSAIDKYFINYKQPICMLLSKKPDGDSSIGVHQDPSLLRFEDREQHLGIWIPLVDTDQKNGSMRVIKGSHLFFPAVQSLSLPSPFDKIRGSLDAFATPINLKMGQALLFDNRILHSSYANQSRNFRTAAIIRITNKDAGYVNFHYNAARASVDVTHHPDDFYLAHSYLKFRNQYPSKNDVKESFAFDLNFVNLEGFKRLIAAHG